METFEVEPVAPGVVVVRGEIDLSTAKEFGRALCMGGAEELVVDMSACTFIDSTGLNELVKAAAERRVIVKGAPAVVEHPIRVTGLDALIQLDSTAAD